HRRVNHRHHAGLADRYELNTNQQGHEPLGDAAAQPASHNEHRDLLRTIIVPPRTVVAARGTVCGRGFEGTEAVPGPPDRPLVVRWPVRLKRVAAPSSNASSCDSHYHSRIYPT